MSTGNAFRDSPVSLNVNFKYIYVNSSLSMDQIYERIVQEMGGTFSNGWCFLVIKSTAPRNEPPTKSDIIYTSTLLFTSRDLSGDLIAKYFTGLERFPKLTASTLVEGYGTMVNFHLDIFTLMNNMGWVTFGSKACFINSESNLNSQFISSSSQFQFKGEPFLPFVSCLSFDANTISDELLAALSRPFAHYNTTIVYSILSGTKFPVATGAVNHLNYVPTPAPVTGHVLTYTGFGAQWVPQAPTDVSTLAALTDVDYVPPPTDGQALVYVNFTDKWTPQTIGTNKVTKDGDTTLNNSTALRIGTINDAPVELIQNNLVMLTLDPVADKLQTYVGYGNGFYNNETIPSILLTTRLPYYMQGTTTLSMRSVVGLTPPAAGGFVMLTGGGVPTYDYTLAATIQIHLNNRWGADTSPELLLAIPSIANIQFVIARNPHNDVTFASTAIYQTTAVLPSIIGSYYNIPCTYIGGTHLTDASLNDNFFIDRLNPTTINDLYDTNITDNTNGNVLTYDNPTQMWMSKPLPATLSTNLYEYRTDTTLQVPPPAVTRLRYNNTTQISSTHLYFSHEQIGNIDIEVILLLYPIGTKIIIQDKVNHVNYQQFTISVTPTGVANSYIDFEVTFDTSGGTGTTNFADNHPVITMFIAQSGGGGGSVTNVSALTLGTTGTDLTSSVANSSTTPVITLNVPNASATNRGALTATDWTTFNSKPSTIATQGDVAFTLPIGNGETLTYNTGTGKWKNSAVIIGKTDNAVVLRSQGTGVCEVQAAGTANVNVVTTSATSAVICNYNLTIPAAAATNKLVTAIEHTLARQIAETAVSKALTTVEYVRSLIPVVAYGSAETSPLQRSDTLMTANSWSYYINIRCTTTFTAANLIFQVLSGSGNVRGAIYTGRVGSGVPVLKAQTANNLCFTGVQSRVLTAEVGQDLNFVRGSDYVLCLSDDGVSTKFAGYSVVVDTNISGVNTTDYSAAGFPVNPPALTGAGTMPCIQII